MCTDYVEEKRDLIRAIPKDRKLSDLPKISQVRHFFLSVFFLFSHKGLSNAKWLIIFFHFTQPSLIIWGEHDQVFPLELAYRLKRSTLSLTPNFDFEAWLIDCMNFRYSFFFFSWTGNYRNAGTWGIMLTW